MATPTTDHPCSIGSLNEVRSWREKEQAAVAAAAGGGGGDQTWLPPGFRFHPTDEELVSYYLAQKVCNSSFAVHAIAEVDLNKCEPWDLPGKNLSHQEAQVLSFVFSFKQTNQKPAADQLRAQNAADSVLLSRHKILELKKQPNINEETCCDLDLDKHQCPKLCLDSVCMHLLNPENQPRLQDLRKKRAINQISFKTQLHESSL
jgi:hypothetical protein